ncbi:MAG: hypothetical protein Q7W51_01955 [Coriobacteriia bacterium]|nr:hypothetical protein [Coriobacteriia bacterium]
MADIDTERHVSTVERGSGAVWGIVALLAVVLLILLFVWPGWVVAPFAGDSDTINIEQEQPDQDINIVTPSDETT